MSQKKPDPSAFANIFAKIKNFKTKFCRLKGHSYQRIMAKFQPNISYRTKVMPLLVSRPPFLIIQKRLTLYKNVVKSNIEKLLTNTLDNASETCF